jgi:mannose-1-phosphate guanylyltransferase
MPEVWGADARGNALHGDVVALDGGGNVVLGGRRVVALLGVDDLVVVDTEDALLVCPRARAQDVRRVVEELARRKRTALL